MSIRNPVKADVDVRNAFEDVIQEFAKLKRELATLTERVESQHSESEDTEEATTNSDTPRHSDLTDLLEDDHTQYLLKTGGIVSGDLSVSGALKARISPYAFCMRDDFTVGTPSTSGSIGELGWTVYTSAGGSTDTETTAVTNHPGLQCLFSGTTNAAITALYHHSTSYSIYLGDLKVVTFVAASNGKNTRTSMIIGSSVAGDNNYTLVGFELLSTDTNWHSVTHNGTSSTRKDTGVAWSNAVFHTFQMVRTAAQTWEFYIDGVLKTTHTGAGETVPADSTGVQIYSQVKSNGTDYIMWIDLIDAYAEVTRG